MCAATSQMVAKVAELMELRKMIEDLNAEAELIADEIKSYMGEEETMTAGSYLSTNLNQGSIFRGVQDAGSLGKLLGQNDLGVDEVDFVLSVLSHSSIVYGHSNIVVVRTHTHAVPTGL